MAEAIKPGIHIPFEPTDIPGLISFWNFDQSADHFVAAQGAAYTLQSQSGILDVIEDEQAPLGGTALRIEEGQWLNIRRKDCPALDIHGKDGHLTVIAWVNRSQTAEKHCEFIAGQWNETNYGRQYGLFLNISVWGLPDRICGHLSHVGGPTSGYKYCTDGAMGATEIKYNEWNVIAMSYDGQAGYAWLNGSLDARPGLNPYPMAGGLHDGGTLGSDFTVGAVNHSGKIGNFFKGCIAGLAAYNRALTPAEILALSKL